MKMCDLRGLVAHRAPFRSNPVRNRVSTTAIQVRHSLLHRATIHGQGFIKIVDIMLLFTFPVPEIETFFLSCGSRDSSSVCIPTRLLGERPKNQGSILSKGRRSFPGTYPATYSKETGEYLLGGKMAWTVDHSFESTGGQESCCYIFTDPDFSMS
jgi:hypothetical protein